MSAHQRQIIQTSMKTIEKLGTGYYKYHHMGTKFL